MTPIMVDGKDISECREEYPGGPLVDGFGSALVRCNRCGHLYFEDELELFEETDEDGTEYFKGCPECETDGYLADVYLSDVRDMVGSASPASGARQSVARSQSRDSGGRFVSSRPKAKPKAKAGTKKMAAKSASSRSRSSTKPRSKGVRR